MAAVLVVALGAFVVANQDAQSTAGATGQYTAPAANAIAAEGGNVTENTVESNASTTKWQGFWGNVSGSLRLGDGSAIFYDWSGVTFQAIYASPAVAPSFGSLSGVDAALDLEALDTAFGLTSADADSIASTMTGNTCVAGTEITAAAGVTPNGAGAWETCVGDSGALGLGSVVFGTNIASGEGYNGDTIDYQIMVPAQGAGTDYYFFLEI